MILRNGVREKKYIFGSIGVVVAAVAFDVAVVVVVVSNDLIIRCKRRNILRGKDVRALVGF